MPVEEKVHIVGIGDDGVEGITAHARRIVESAEVAHTISPLDASTAASIDSSLTAASAAAREASADRVTSTPDEPAVDCTACANPAGAEPTTATS